MRFLLMIAAAAAVSVGAISAQAQNDQGQAINEKARPSKEQLRLSKDLPGTAVIRVNNLTGQVEVAHYRQKLPRSPKSVNALNDADFTPVDSNGQAINQVSANQWGLWNFFFRNSLWWQPSYSYRNYYYNYDNNYYSYPYSGYNYYYYSWPYYGYNW